MNIHETRNICQKLKCKLSSVYILAYAHKIYASIRCKTQIDRSFITILNLLTYLFFFHVFLAPPVLGEVSPSFLIQKEGDTIDMFCEASATPEPSLTWYKDGKVSFPNFNNFRVRNRRPVFTYRISLVY